MGDSRDDAIEMFLFDRAQLSFLFTHVRDVVICFDADGLITFASPGLRELSGHDPETVLGTSVFAYLHPDDVKTAMDAMVRWKGRKGAVQGPEMRIRLASGGWRTVTVESLSGPEIEPVGAMAITIAPLTDQSEIEGELRRRLVNEDRLTRLARAFVDLPLARFDDGVQAALAEMGSLEGVDRVSIYRLAPDGFLDRTHEWSAPDMPSTSEVVRRIPRDGPELVRLLALNREVNIPDVDALDDSWQAERSFWHEWGVRSFLAVPMVEQGELTGYVSFKAIRERRHFEVSHVTTLRSAAGILAQAFAGNEAERRLAHQARHDSLTGLGNRWYFLGELDAALRRLATVAGGPGLAAILLDLDRFKVVNDSLGHTAGDELLKRVATNVAASLGPTETIARLGGDELVVLLDDIDGPSVAVRRARELQRQVAAPVEVGGHEVVITASAGVAFTYEKDDADELLRRADAAMYLAKERGRNRIEVFDDELRAKVNERLRHESELRLALRSGQLQVYYQPEFDIVTGEMVAAEALVRWDHPIEGLLAAAEFIHIAEETAAIFDIGSWVLREALVQRRHWRGLIGDRPFKVRVNLSARQVNQPDLVPMIVSALEESGVDPACLCLELTETALMVDPDSSASVLAKLHSLGVELAIDDFGTGYGSLTYLKRYPIDVVKIDRSFVDGLGNDPEDTAIVGAIIGLAGALGVAVTAEGVETDCQLAELRRLGCRRVQGFLLARPEPPLDMAARLGA